MGAEKTEHTRSQKKEILEYMMNHDGITPKEAEEHIGSMRLSARIKDLRDDGYSIKTYREKTKTRHGHTATYARYRLETEG